MYPTRLFLLLLSSIIWHAASAQANSAGFEIVGTPTENRVLVLKEGKYGYLDGHNRLVIAPRFDGAFAFADGRAAVMTADTTPGSSRAFWFLIDSSGNTIVNDTFDHVELLYDSETGNEYAFSEGLAYVHRGDQKLVVDLQGRKVLDWKEGWRAPFHFGWIVSGKDSSVGITDRSGRIVLAERYHSITILAKGLAVARKGRRLGILSQQGFSGLKYDDFRHRDDGLLEVVEKGLRGLLRSDGVVLSKPRYTSIGTLSEGMIEIEQKERWGFMDSTGRLRIKPQFASVSGFMNGKTRVSPVKGEDFYINYAGKQVPETYHNLPNPGNLKEAEARLLEVLNDLVQRHPYANGEALHILDTPYQIRNGILSGVTHFTGEQGLVRQRWTVPVSELTEVWLDYNMGLNANDEKAVLEEAVGDGPFRVKATTSWLHMAAPGDGLQARRLAEQLRIALRQLQGFMHR